jgi:iron complex transport system substrate-binding protein
VNPRAGSPCRIASGLLTLLVSATAGADIKLPQSDGTTLELKAPAERVITLAPNLAEMMFEAGAGANLIATVEYSNHPEQAGRLPRIGDAFRFDLERILALRPDLVIGWSSGNPAAALDRLESLGLKVWRTELRRPADIAGLLEHMALATGAGDAGFSSANAVRSRLDRLVEKYAGRGPVRYFYQVAERPLFTLNGEHIVSQGLALCGGVNVFAGEPALAPQVTREAVLLADPSVLIAPQVPGAADPLGHWREWPRLGAVKNGALILLSADRISRATPRMLDSLEIACNLLDRHRPEGSQTEEE